MPGTLVSAEEWGRLCFDGPVIGVDEAGRGAWAGSVVVAAALLPDLIRPELLAEIRDSKRISPRKREWLGGLLRWEAAYATGRASAGEIDTLGLAQAVAQAAADAIHALLLDWRESVKPPATVLLDGNRTNWARLEPLLAETRFDQWYYMVRADSLVKVVAAASILAKTERDSSMRQAALCWPGYGFERHFGYGTPEHIAALELKGISQIHRRSYRPLWCWVPVHERLEYRARRWRGK